MNARTQISLSDEQRQALKLLLAASDQSVSDLVRQAVERLLSDELAASAGSSNCTSRGHFKMYRPERSRMVAIVG
jgi:hypothetical protein